MTEQTEIIVMDDEPFLVRGPLVMTDAEGNEFRTERRTVTLCRCGASASKPFCDGAHANAGL